jgi:hypothetical protein
VGKTDPLIQEAKKGEYLYHGTQSKEIIGQPKISSGKMGDAFYLTTDKQKAASFGREKNISDDIINNKGEVVKRIIREPNAYKTSNVFEFDPKDLKIKTVENDKQFFDLIPSGEIKDANQTFRLMGYDGVFNKDTGTYAIYDTSKLKPKTVDPLIQEAKKYKSAEELQNVLPTAKIKTGSVYPNSLDVTFPEGGGIEYQELPDKIIIRAVSNGSNPSGTATNVSSGIATKAVNSLLETARKMGKDVEVTGIHNYSYWKKMGFPPTEDFKSTLTNSQLIDIWNKANR